MPYTASTDAFIDTLKANGLRRAYLVTDSEGTLRGSHPALDPLVEAVAADPSYRLHQGCFFEIGEQSDHLLSAFVHQTTRGQSAGGVRYWSYGALGDFVRDGLRLSRAMGQKCALAGLWWGGGKGVIARRQGKDHHDPELRRAVYRDYGRFISSLGGCYVTAEDVGTTPPDMAEIFTTTRHTTCIPGKMGGSGNPSLLTATGVVVGMEAALSHLGQGELEGKTVAMQGLGNVSRFMIADLLARKVERIVGADIDQRAISAIRQEFGEAVDARLVDENDMSILAEACDVIAPNAVGASLNPDTIPAIKAPIICGAANNQLADVARDGDALQRNGVLYVPDFLCNRMGIVNCANEQYGVFEGDPAITAHLERDAEHGVFRRALQVFSRAEKEKRSTAMEAEVLADELTQVRHPLWPDRGRQIIDALVASSWSTQATALT